MGEIDIDACCVTMGSGGPRAAVTYVIDMPEHPFDLPVAGRTMNIVRVPVGSWDDALTPWPAQVPELSGRAFGGGADETLECLFGEVAPAVEEAYGLAPSARAICGYSLGGLFALYAFARMEGLAACAFLSGSVWYPGWTDCLRDHAFYGEGRYVFLSLGSKERRGGPAIMRTVQDRMEECVYILHGYGCTVEFQLGPGNHMQHHRERFDTGLGALDRYLKEER